MTYTFNLNTNTSTNFNITLNDKTYKVHIKYVTINNSYVIDIDSFENGVYKNIINSVPLNIGVDLMLPWRGIGLGRLYCIPTDKRYFGANPTAQTIKDYYVLQWSDK